MPGVVFKELLWTPTDILDLWELAGSQAFEQGSIAIMEARWVLNILFLFFSRDSFDSYL